ncbi:hypothetical protein [Actinomycetospora straminea]|uniref:Secreted protein n=1 Tax=Actinomycetospora straminea TaxID=663607 RepID=A0ABP9ECQ9_9PSEU|nr:hypothetical protein [Actinomycetospora straminea]MDD7932079.1 hypothetical protein [Actinomycetospora straminea]
MADGRTGHGATRPIPTRGPRCALGAAVAVGAVVASVLAAVVTAPPAAALPAAESWSAELAVTGGDDGNVVASGDAVRLRDLAPRPTSAGPVPAEGTLLLPPRRPAAITDRVAADVTADVPAGAEVVVAVRGIRDDGTWSEWREARPDSPARLDEPTFEVQVRVTLVAAPDGTGPALRRLWLTADRAPLGLGVPRPTTPLTSRVFATRIGLVGNDTANGHEVERDDRFVALPSRRSLAPQESGDYTVRVCATETRCTWAPVWDVGPWNTTDDYWSEGPQRQAFGDLPRGRPQAEAAFTDGYRGGRDGSGRRVRNPAGIDLADGTFRDDLGLRDNAWVTVTYLWTGTGPSAPARDREARLDVRAAPAPDAAVVGSVAPHARVSYDCAVDTAAGRTGAGARWLRLGPAQFVPADQVEARDVPSC